MSAIFHIDRHFLFMHGQNLAVFAERVLRKTCHNVCVPNRIDLWEDLNKSCTALHEVLEKADLKRKARTEAIREKESEVLVALGKLAEHVETAAACKSDVFTTGFRPHAEHQRLLAEGVETRRRQRITAKMAQLEAE